MRSAPKGVVKALVTLAVIVGLPLAAAGAELYGKPLRGLSAVPIAEVVKAPERFTEKAIRVAGTAHKGASAGLTLTDGGATLAVETDGSFSLPEKLDGIRLMAEGRVRKGEGPVVFVATGAEVVR